MSFNSYINKNSKYFFIAWFFLIVVISSIPYLPIPKIRVSNSIVRLDYIIHFLEFFILSFFFIIWRLNKKSKVKLINFFLYIVLGVCIALLNEVYQKIIPGRTFNLIDSLFNCIGFAVGILFVFLYKRRQKIVNT